jgi:hypothetical protein
MSEWLNNLEGIWQSDAEAIGGAGFLALLGASALAAFAVALLYMRFYGRRATGSEIHRSFPLLGVAITAIFVCIQFSLPLSLGLLGALSIVRFRTPIKEPEEIGFLMVVIATSLACATGRLLYLGLVLVGAAVVLVAQEAMRPVFRRRADSGLVVGSWSDADYEAASSELWLLLGRAARRGALESISAQDGRVTVTWRFHGLPTAEAPQLERLLIEKTRPESLSIVYASGGA